MRILAPPSPVRDPMNPTGTDIRSSDTISNIAAAFLLNKHHATRDALLPWEKYFWPLSSEPHPALEELFRHFGCQNIGGDNRAPKTKRKIIDRGRMPKISASGVKGKMSVTAKELAEKGDRCELIALPQASVIWCEEIHPIRVHRPIKYPGAQKIAIPFVFGQHNPLIAHVYNDTYCLTLKPP